MEVLIFISHVLHHVVESRIIYINEKSVFKIFIKLMHAHFIFLFLAILTNELLLMFDGRHLRAFTFPLSLEVNVPSCINSFLFLLILQIWIEFFLNLLFNGSVLFFVLIFKIFYDWLFKFFCNLAFFCNNLCSSLLSSDLFLKSFSRKFDFSSNTVRRCKCLNSFSRNFNWDSNYFFHDSSSNL